MKKIKLFLAAVAAMVGLSVQAQSWTAPGSDPVSGQEYYIMNLGVGQFLTGANSWGTQISMTTEGTGLRVRLEQGTFTVGGQSLSGWEIVNVTNSNKLFFRDSEGSGFVDKGNQDKGFVWNITKVNGAYRLQTAAGDPTFPAAVVQYANATAAGGAVVFDNGPMASNIDWMFFTPEQATAENVVARARLYAALIRAYNEGMDTDAAAAVYENASATSDEMAAAVTALNNGRYANALAKASNSDPRDITEFVLTNADFSAGNTGGWETNYVSGQQANNIGYQGNKYANGNVAISKFIEAWRNNAQLGDGYLRQTVSGLPEGKYVLEADAIAVWQKNENLQVTGAQLYITADGADYKTELNTLNEKPQHFSTEFLFTGEGDVIFGLRTIGATNNWLCADNFKVTFYGIDLSAYVTQLAAAVAEFDALDKSAAIASVYDAQKAIVDENNKEWTSSKTYAAAIAAVQTATATVQETITAKANLANAVKAADAVEFTIPTSIYANIAAVVAEKNIDYGTVAEYDAATAAITAAINENATSELVKAYSLVADAWAIYNESYTDANGAKATFKAVIDAIDEKTTAEEIATAIETANLPDAVQAFIAEVTLAAGHRFNITNFFLVNADFEEACENGKMPNGWNITITGQNCGQQNRTDTNPETGLAITNFIEAWHPRQLGSGVIAQTVSSLPEGTYVLECDASICHDPAGADDITGANLFVQSSLKKEVSEPISNVRLRVKHHSVSFVHGGEGEVTFGLEANNTNANWLSADNFKVYYAGGVPLSTYAEILADAVAEFEALEEASDATDYATYKAIVEEYNKEWSSKSEYQTAISAVNGAASDLSALISAKAAFNAAVAAANEAKAANANVTGSELTALDAAIAATSATAAEYTAATETLTAATSTFTAAAPSYNKYAAYKAETIALFGSDLEVAAPNTAAEAEVAFQNLNVAQYNKVATEYPFSLTSKIGDFSTWTGTATIGADRTADKPNSLSWEHWSGVTHPYYEQCANGYSNAGGWTIQYTKTTTLPAGSYVVKVAARSSAGVTSSVTCSALSGVEISLPCAGNNTRGINTNGVASWNAEDTFISTGGQNATVGGTGAGWQWRFLPFTLDEETEVTMTFYAEASSQNQWMSIGDGELLSATDIATAVAYNETANNTIEDEDVANVTITRTIKASYNTVVLPFDCTLGQVEAAFGTGAEVYAFSENGNDANNITINFNRVNAGTISANVPVLVKATAASNEQTFNGVHVVAPTQGAAAQGTNANFIGVFGPTTVTAGDYFIGNGAVYKSQGQTNIKAFRAYIDVDNTVAGEVKLYIDGITTGISEINGEAQTEQGAIYTLAGQRVSRAQKGIYIVNGKKVAVK